MVRLALWPSVGKSQGYGQEVEKVAGVVECFQTEVSRLIILLAASDMPCTLHPVRFYYVLFSCYMFYIRILNLTPAPHASIVTSYLIKSLAA